MKIRFIFLVVCLFFSTHGNCEKKQKPINLEDLRGKVDLTVCTQNLHNYGLFEDAKTKSSRLTEEDLSARTDALVRRFTSAKCDVIAVQEVLGKTEQKAKEGLTQLTDRLRVVSGRFFDVVVGPPSEGILSLGFLIAKDRAEIMNLVSYDKVELPKLTPKQKPRRFTRGPLELQIIVKGDGSEIQKTITLVNLHFKSQRGGAGDPAGLQWETYRMEMAEGLRRIVEERHKLDFASGESILILLGDRNSNFDLASARILEGTVTLKNFQDPAQCRLSKRGVPLCKAGETNPQRLFSVFTTNAKTKSLPGSFEYKGIYSWLDEILMPQESLRYAWDTPNSDGEYNSGLVYKPKEASDHAMGWVRLNW